MKTCTDCNTEFNGEDLTFAGKVVFATTRCDACNEKAVEEAKEAQAKIARKASQTAFWEEVPTLYQDTDLKRLNPILVKGIASWTYGAKGIGMIGQSGAGKTRAAVELLKMFYYQNKSICFLKATKLTQHAQDKFSDTSEIKNKAIDRIRRAYTCHILLLDDLGKGRLPASAEELLYDLIDERTERGLPVIWTSNANADQLHSMLSADRGQPILRRLAEFSTIINL
jgi:DNA replication protein DnaC